MNKQNKNISKNTSQPIGPISPSEKVNIIFASFAANFTWWMRGKDVYEVSQAKKLWQQEIEHAGLTDDQCADGINGVIRILDKTPTIKEFVEFAKPKKHEAHQTFPALALPAPRNPSVRAREMEKINGLLKKVKLT